MEELEEPHRVRPEAAPGLSGPCNCSVLRHGCCCLRGGLPRRRLLRHGALPQRKENLQGEHAQGVVVHPGFVLLQETGVWVRFQVLVPIDHEHPSGRREVTWVTRYVHHLEVVMPSGCTDRKPKIEKRKVLFRRLFTDEEVVCRDVSVVGDSLEAKKDRGHLQEQCARGGASACKVACAKGAFREGALEDLCQGKSLQAVLIHSIEPLV
mmetsp:Transcript_28657/g.78645  ORF Transcript_28657/g.78645 Transcript_28657/m.78645 type:complete len:209 (+) Transcript_28657:1224-1850(+)